MFRIRVAVLKVQIGLAILFRGTVVFFIVDISLGDAASWSVFDAANRSVEIPTLNNLGTSVSLS